MKRKIGRKITKKKGGANTRTIVRPPAQTPLTLTRRYPRGKLYLDPPAPDVDVDMSLPHERRSAVAGTILRSSELGPGRSVAAPETLMPSDIEEPKTAMPFTEKQIEDFFIEKRLLFRPKNKELIKFYVIYEGRKKFFNLEIQYLLNDYYRRSEPDSNIINFKVNGVTISFSLDEEYYYVVFIDGIKFGDLQYDISKSDSGKFVNSDFFDVKKSKYLLGQNNSFHNDLRTINEEKKKLEKSKKNIEKGFKQEKPALDRLEKTIIRLGKIVDITINNIVNKKKYKFQNLYADSKYIFLPLKILSRYNKTKTYEQYCDELVTKETTIELIKFLNSVISDTKKKYADKISEIKGNLKAKEIKRQALIESFEHWCGRTELDNKVLETPEGIENYCHPESKTCPNKATGKKLLRTCSMPYFEDISSEQQKMFDQALEQFIKEGQPLMNQEEFERLYAEYERGKLSSRAFRKIIKRYKTAKKKFKSATRSAARSVSKMAGSLGKMAGRLSATFTKRSRNRRSRRRPNNSNSNSNEALLS